MTGRGSEPQLSVIWWRDIPAQVVARDGANTVKAELAGRFQVAIDQAAMRAGLADSEGYLEQWDRRTRPCSADLQAEVDAEVGSLESRFRPEVLSALVQAARPTSDPASRSTPDPAQDPAR